MSNFKFLLSDPSFAPFMEVAMAAEKILHIDPAESWVPTFRNTDMWEEDKC